ncbi:MAPEG family protein [Xylophilus ampelinus]|uniref:Putative MAPEG superfamily protein n=1 Tax=Xylophilus ampelinus TaxID=54067 RepID=A0A318SQK7_9BURK|nr:MAPEG family protein [Xylophilus ampelinus]MCS4508770.1 MAPEG family protein [Xylophilus ampelinus]PYE79340.1 putative MAPEG superfamily protein [Xylophilus ampelinus]
MNGLSSSAATVGAVQFTIAYWCVLAAALLPILCAVVAKAGAQGYDNRSPRVWAEGVRGWRARAMAAQQNGFESLPFFIGAVVVAHQLAAPQGRLDLLAVGWVLVRVAYSAIYIAGGGAARSAVYALGFALNVAILFVGCR